MDDESAKPEEQEHQAAGVDGIRDILFGSQTRQYDKRFDQMVAQLDRIDGQLEQLGKALKRQEKALESHVRDLQKKMRKRSSDTEVALGELREETASALSTLAEGKASRDSVGDMLLEMGTRLKGSDQISASREKLRDKATD